MFPIIIDAHVDYLAQHVIDPVEMLSSLGEFEYSINLTRSGLIPHYQSSKLFLFPLQWEEPFGLVMAESLATSTPVVAYARGSVPEIVHDGVTGLIVNPKEQDIRGDFIVKKTGIAVLMEAVERIYSLSHEAYRQMRLACRQDAETKFNRKRVTSEYISVYQSLTQP